MIELAVIAIGLFLANRWNSILAEIVAAYFPAGEKLGEKVILNVILTFLLVYGLFAVLKWDKRKDKK